MVRGGGAFSFSDVYLQALLWAPRPPGLLSGRSFPVGRHNIGRRFAFFYGSPPPPKKSRLSLTISPFGPLNPCGPFSPASPWRRQIKHTQLFTDGPGPSQPGRRYYKILE